MIRISLTLCVLSALAAGCGAEGGSTAPARAGGPAHAPDPAAPTVTETAGPEMSGTGLEGPPPYRLRYGDHELVLRPHTWCYRAGCVDGVSPAPPSVGSPTVIRVRVPVDGWDLSATFTPTDQRCGRRQTVEPVKQGDWYVLHPTGHSGSYDVELFAQGDGDMVAGFRWVTTADGELPTPEAALAVIAENDGRADSYGVELMLENLASTPTSAKARIIVTAANGRSLTFDATRARQRCRPVGSVFFDGPDTAGTAAAGLGDLPFHYDVRVTLDGVTYRASADYPRDQIPDYEPSVALAFSPTLPGLS